MKKSVTSDKQLHGISLDDVLQKRRLGQALNLKEFAVLAGISYSVAREWAQITGFPRFEGVVFWEDFINWKNQRNRTRAFPKTGHEPAPSTHSTDGQHPKASLPARAAQILSEALQ